MGGDGLVSLAEAADAVGLHYMTVYRYVRTGVLPAVRQGAAWRVDPADLARFMARPRASGRPAAGGRATRLGTRVRRLERRLVAGDEPGAWAVLEDALAAGASGPEVLLGLLAPTMRAIGEGWAVGRLTVADEHQASGVAMRLVGRLGPRLRRRGPARGVVVVGAAPGEQHQLPVAVAADVLRANGFEVVDLGPDVPADMFAVAAAGAAAPRLVAVAVGATTPGRDGAIAAAAAAARAARPDVAVLAGGSALTTAAAAEALGARWSGLDAAALVRAVEIAAAGP